jgi:hypothetical protein
MVIDGVIDLSLEGETIATDQAMGFENTMGSFFEYCRETSCNFSGSQDPQEAYLDIVQQIDDETMPRPNIGSRSWTRTARSRHIVLSLSGGKWLGRIRPRSCGCAQWRSIGSSCKVSVLTPVETPQGRYDGSYLSFLSINCSDGNIGGVDDMQTLAESISDKAPVFGESGIYLGIACATWPGTQPVEVLDVEFENDAPIVVIGTTGDPATPI